MHNKDFTRLYESEDVLQRFILQSEAMWQSVRAFCNSFIEDDLNHVIEGVALLPGLVATLPVDKSSVLFVGNTNRESLAAMIEFSAQQGDKDWMNALGYSTAKKQVLLESTLRMSEWFKDEARERGFTYVELGNDWEKSIEKAAETLAFSPSIKYNGTLVSECSL